MSHMAWNAATPYLSASRNVIAFDIPGFGLTPPLPASTPPTISNLVDALERSIARMNIALPADFAGNSLGGCMALEAARRGIARSVVAISPSGLWNKQPPRHVGWVFSTLRFSVKMFPRLVKRAVQVATLRELALAVPISVGSRHMPVSDALRAIDDLAAARAFEETFNNTRAPFSGNEITVPVIVAFGDRDWILTKHCRQKTALPPHIRWITKRCWGHVPMWADPVGVAQLILEGTR